MRARDYRLRIRPPVLVADADVIGTFPGGSLPLAKVREVARLMDEAPRLCWVCNEYEVRDFLPGMTLPVCWEHRGMPPAMIPPSPSGADASWRRGVWA